jgi:transposase-like protein
MVLEHENEHASQWAAITSIAEKIGWAAETLRICVRQAQRDQGQRPGLTTEERQHLKQLERASARQRDPKKGGGMFRPGGALLAGQDRPSPRTDRASNAAR